ncbi:MAG: sodium:solute symporter family protein [Candidatus Neomarinimicrobiota bacterium]|nr:sodium:solute symporter family protein [Candidatus Neomarinimicrobiota bacterium]
MNSVDPAILVGIGFYLAGMLSVGFYASRKIKDAGDFLVAGRRLSLWLCTATLMATWMGGGAILGGGGAAYEKGFLGVIADPFGASVCLFLAGLFYVRMIRRMRLVTVIDFFEMRFGKTAGLFSSVIMISVFIGWTGSLLVSIGFVLHALTGLPENTGIIIGGLIVLVYTVAGGMWAVSLTDFFQMIILMVGLVIAFAIIINQFGGIEGFIAAAPKGSFRMLPENATLSEWMSYIRMWMVAAFGYLAGQDLIQRALSSRDESVAQNSAYFSALLYLVFGLLAVLIGIAGSVLMPGLDNPELIIPKLAIEYLPSFLIVVFISALLAAAMSSADSSILATASVFGQNVVPHLPDHFQEKGTLWWTRLSVSVSAVIAMMVALYVGEVYSLLLDSFSILLVGLFLPLTAGIWWPRTNTPGALASMFGGTAAWLMFMKLTPELPSDVIGWCVGFVLLLFVTFLTSERTPPLPLADMEGKPLEYANRLGTLSPFQREGAL